jgi:macrolide-specific efflux system membrane fusion protein
VDKILIKEGDKVKTGQIIAWMSSADRAAILDAARSHGAKELKKWEGMYRPTPIVSPSSGTIIALNIVPGQTVVESLIAFELSDRLIISAQVDEADIGFIKTGMKARIKIDAFPLDTIETQVVRISEQSTTANSVNVFNVLLVPVKEVKFLKSGMTASVQFVVYHRDNAVVLPTWISEGKENTELTLNKKGSDGEAIPVKVKVGRSNGDKLEVLGGLEPGTTLLYKPMQLTTDAPKGLMGGMLQKKKK